MHPSAQLKSQVVAVDVSIWLTQFIKAMRDGDGNMIKNAHLLGTFRRVCKVRESVCERPLPRVP